MPLLTRAFPLRRPVEELRAFAAALCGERSAVPPTSSIDTMVSPTNPGMSKKRPRVPRSLQSPWSTTRTRRHHGMPARQRRSTPGSRRRSSPQGHLVFQCNSDESQRLCRLGSNPTARRSNVQMARGSQQTNGGVAYAAMTWGIWPQRTCERSASTVTARTPCDVCSLCHCPRTKASKYSGGPARGGGS